ncbi:fasciclin domain-containing protein [Leptothoe sp. PORK10 BA2]|uniref:fasciclin domain-containing protein n=1 Tax=Leptothoe sp. PORK10 BA2 TaxID=3110254 RepID=UPI002B1ECAF6|nr:fasciclin domain-containing protein [Leptothoe sp. PORK10 BA2]MEA5466167.1 fasciclin domain-containing protein [Leptothoe sp. PORK10 BA2]
MQKLWAMHLEFQNSINPILVGCRISNESPLLSYSFMNNIKKITFLLSFLAVSLTIPAVQAKEVVSLQAKDGHAGNTIVSIASTNDSFNVLTALLKHAKLVGVLNGETEFTVFAPTDDAFGRLPKGTIESLYQPENRELLATILTYHVVPGSVRSTELSSGAVDSVAGIPLTISVGSGVTVNRSNVVTADIEASNGIIHVIDQVLLPPQ